ncbi:retrovirus-related Pol polyprotein from transposon 412 [Trichonephila clavipes]|nr:retrovirus-related Pol polyprotein from transposon 412 [Trichonephila clavipes]
MIVHFRNAEAGHHGSPRSPLTRNVVGPSHMFLKARRERSDYVSCVGKLCIIRNCSPRRTGVRHDNNKRVKLHALAEPTSETYIQFAARLTANFQYYCSLRKVNSFESLCDLIISDKLFEALNKETATHIGIREAEDWFRPIDLAKECDIYISSRSGSHKEIPITYGYTQDPFKNRSQNFKTKIKENYPQYLERENKNCFICGDSSHCARDCEKRFKPKESNDHIHNRINVNTLKIESEKQK